MQKLIQLQLSYFDIKKFMEMENFFFSECLLISFKYTEAKLTFPTKVPGAVTSTKKKITREDTKKVDINTHKKTMIIFVVESF